MTEAWLYLVDTNVFISSSKGREPASSWLDGALRSPTRIAVSTVTIGEFFSGTPPLDRPRVERFFGQLRTWPVTTQIAIRAGIYRHDFARRGMSIHLPDALIAATAAMTGAVLVTDNVKDFPMADVRVLSLRA